MYVHFFHLYPVFTLAYITCMHFIYTEHQRRIFSIPNVVRWRSVIPAEVRKKKNEIPQVRQTYIFYQRPNS